MTKLQYSSAVWKRESLQKKEEKEKEKKEV